MKSTLLIGGGGFIGRHLLSSLAGKRRLTVMGRHPKPPQDFPEGTNYFCHDFTDLHGLKEVLSQHQEIIHLAYASVPKTSFDHPIEDINENLPPIIQLFECLKEIKIDKLLLISSGGTVYGEAQTHLIDESHPTNPLSPYGITKLTMEKYGLMYHHSHGIPVMILRPSNPYGPWQLPFRGQGFIATAMASILKNKPLTVFGEEGSTRDYLYITDLAEAIAGLLFEGKIGQTYNIGSGVGFSNLQVIQAVSKLTQQENLPVHLEKFPKRIFDVQENILNSQKLKETIGWEPKIKLEQGLPLTWEWIKKYVVT